MKIVRLTEDNGRTAYFDNTFNDEIELPPFSEVALSSVSVNTDPLAIDIPVGSQLRWKQGVETNITGSLRPAEYSSLNYEDLFFDIKGNMNLRQATDGNKGAGRQWAVSDKPNLTGFGTAGKVSIGFQTANYEGGAKEAYEHTNLTETGTGLDATYSRTAGINSEGDAESVLLSAEPIGWGRSRFYVNMKTATDSGGVELDQGVFIGLSSVDHVAAKTLPAANDVSTIMGIHIRRAGVKALVSGGQLEEDDALDTGSDIAVGSIFGFESYPSVGDGQPNFYGVHILPDGTEEVLTTAEGEFGETWNQLDYGERGTFVANTPLYPFVLFYGPSANTVVDQIQFSPDPYSIISNKKYPVITKTNGTRGLQNGGEKPIVNFDFKNSTSIGRFLGFTESKMKSMTADVTVTDATKYAWTADELFGEGVAGQGFYVELMTGTCEGYDGLTGQRKNILAVIPESDSDSKILFQPSFPTFLEMNNSHPLVLRNIRARLLQTDGSSVEVTGLNSMTLLYKPGSSK